MNWFEILKNPVLVQRQKQRMKPIDIQKPFKRVKEEEDCTQKIIDEFERLCQKFYGKTGDKREYPNAVYIYLNAQPHLGFASFKIEYPETNKEKKAYCAFYRDFAQGRNFYPSNPQVDEFAKNDWSKVDDIHSIYTKSQRKDMDSPTSNFNHYASLYDMSDGDYYDKIDLYFVNVPEDAWV